MAHSLVETRVSFSERPDPETVAVTLLLRLD
jgi:hypothetical protein